MGPWWFSQFDPAAEVAQQGGKFDNDDVDAGSTASGSRGRRRGRCYNCGVRGHFSRDCRKPKKATEEKALFADIDDDGPALLSAAAACDFESALARLHVSVVSWAPGQQGGKFDNDDVDAGSTASGSRGRRRGRCYNCGVRGHFSRDCRKPKKATEEKALFADIDDDGPALLSAAAACDFESALARLHVSVVSWAPGQQGGKFDNDDVDAGSTASGSRGRRRGRCYNCGVRGHFSRDCRKPKKATEEKALFADIDDDGPALL
ncbi:hypothetical protein D1007_05784 [Hordeum vulgare]|nr:hypothetical protein D1007_05784 [Hordeum vulgare]